MEDLFRREAVESLSLAGHQLVHSSTHRPLIPTMPRPDPIEISVPPLVLEPAPSVSFNRELRPDTDLRVHLGARPGMITSYALAL